MSIIDQLRQRAKQRQQSQHPQPLVKGGSKPLSALRGPEPIQSRPRPIKTPPRAPEGLKDPIVDAPRTDLFWELREKRTKRDPAPEKMHVIPAAALESLKVLETFTPDQLTGVKISRAETIVNGLKFMEMTRTILQQADGFILAAAMARVARLVDCVPNLSKGPPAAQMDPSSM